MRIGILSSADSWYYRDLERAAGERNHAVMPLTFSSIRSSLGGAARSSCHVESAMGVDAIIVRSMPPGSLEQIVFRMDALGQFERQHGYVLNPVRTLEAAIDKYVTSSRLVAAGLLTPRTEVCQSPEDAHEAFQRLGGDVVVKPLFGGEGRGICRISDPQIAERVFKSLAHIDAVLYLQEFIPHPGFDIRILVVGDKTYSMRRRNENDWRTNISRGAIAEPYTPDDEQRSLALRAAAAIGAPIVGVDLLPASNGDNYLLEVNAVPGWKALARTLDIDLASEVLQLLELQSQRYGQCG